MSELSPLDEEARQDAPPAPSPAETPRAEAAAAAADPSPAVKPPRRWPGFGMSVVLVAVAVAILYGATGVLRETGLYDVSRWGSPSNDTPNLAALSARSLAATAPGAAMPVRKASASTALSATHGAPLRDQPPRTPPAELPRFTVRDGEQYDFLTDLDAETLKRLAEVQGQLDGLGQHVIALRQMVQGLAGETRQQRQQMDVRQTRLQTDLTAARQAIATLQTTVEDVEARLKRAGGGGRAGPFGAATAPSANGRAVLGWSVKAVSGHRAWLRTPKGGEVTVVAGERLKALGAVRAVDARQGIVVMSDGRVVR